jgi:hypothetical protein
MKVTDAKGVPATDVGWEKADLFFLLNALRHGMSIEEAAGFLGKSVDEVREKAHQ